MENTAKFSEVNTGEFSKVAGVNRKGYIFFLFSKFLFVKQSFSDPVCFHYIISIFKSICIFYNIYYLQCLFLESIIRTFTMINDV